MSNQPVVLKAHCNACGQGTNHDLIAERSWREIEVEGDDQFPTIYLELRSEFLQCRGCEAVSMRQTTTCDQWAPYAKDVVNFPPPISRRRPSWAGQLPKEVRQLHSEVYHAIHSNGNRLAIMGARALVDMTIVGKVGDAGTFKQKLEELEQQGYISQKSRDFLDAALEAGNASSHRGHEFKPEEVNEVMDIVENLLQAIYVLEKSAARIRAVTPQRVKAKKGNANL